MTDEEIIKALECCKKTEFISDCAKCEMFAFDCKDTLIENALNLINRQKAEVEQLKIVAGGLEQALKNVTEEVDRLLKECESKEEAYNKEFCLRKELKAKIEKLENDFVNVTKIARSEAKKVRVCEPSSVKAFDGNNKVLTYRCYPCPTCSKWIIDNENHKYCQWCGQKLDWLIDKQRKEDEGK